MLHHPGIRILFECQPRGLLEYSWWLGRTCHWQRQQWAKRYSSGVTNSLIFVPFIGLMLLANLHGILSPGCAAVKIDDVDIHDGTGTTQKR